MGKIPDDQIQHNLLIVYHKGNPMDTTQTKNNVITRQSNIGSDVEYTITGHSLEAVTAAVKELTERYQPAGYGTHVRFVTVTVVRQESCE